MNPIEFDEQTSKIAETQDEYRTLPAHVSPEGVVTSCWELTDDEMAQIVLTGQVWIQLHTFNSTVQPILPSVFKPDLIPIKAPDAEIEQQLRRLVDDDVVDEYMDQFDNTDACKCGHHPGQHCNDVCIVGSCGCLKYVKAVPVKEEEEESTPLMDAMKANYKEVCDACGGDGKRGRGTCKACNGSGVKGGL